MNRETKDQYTVNGFLFGDKADVEIANQELSAIQFIEKKISGQSVETVLAVYQAALEKKMFRTPVGYCYLRDLQKRMIKGGVDKERIPPISLYQVYNDAYKVQERPRRITQTKKETNPDRRLMRNSIWANIIMFFIILVLFIITLTGENANVLNYRNVITNEYSSWEEELTNREQAVREKERELGITITNMEE